MTLVQNFSASLPLRTGRIPILHVVTSMELGGAETMLCQIIEHHDLAKFAPVVVSLRPEGPLSERIRKAGIPVHHLDMKGYASYFSGLKKLKALIRQVRPELVQTWMYHADLLGSLAVRQAAPQTPLVWNLQHSSFDKQGTKTRSKWVRNLLVGRAKSWPHSIIACSHASLEHHAELGYPEEKMVYIPNGADTVRFQPKPAARERLRADLGLPSDAKVIGIAARFDPQKDYTNLFSAIREFQKKDQSTWFVACGNGITAENRALSELRQNCPAPERVLLLGPRRDMPEVYPAFDLATLSSAFGEGLPLTLCEALASGLPIVATSVGDCTNVVGDCGTIVAPGAPAALAQAWHGMMEMPDAAFQQLGRMARLRAEEHFSLRTISKQYEAVYEGLLG